MTIALEQLADGSAADRNFQKLMALVIDTGGVSIGLRFGTGSITFAASTDSGPVTVPHGLGRTAVLAFAVNADTVGSFAGIAGFTTDIPNSTQFRVYGRLTAAATATKTFYWVAIG